MKGLKTFLNESISDAKQYVRELTQQVFAKYKNDKIDVDELMQAMGSLGWTYNDGKSTDTKLNFYKDASSKIRLSVNIIVKNHGNKIEMLEYTYED